MHSDRRYELRSPRATFRLTEASLLSNKGLDAAALSCAHLLVRTGQRKFKVGPRVTCPLTLVCKVDFYKKLASHLESFAPCYRAVLPMACFVCPLRGLHGASTSDTASL